MIGCQDPLESGLNRGSYRKHEMLHSSASGLVVKSNIPIVGPRVRFSAGAWHVLLIYFAEMMHAYLLSVPMLLLEICDCNI